MNRVLSIDYGNKRIGLAISDPLQIIAKPYETISNEKLAEQASDIEINNLKLSLGKQDHYSAAFGGLNYFKFLDKERGMLVSASSTYAPVVIRELDTFQFEGVVSRSVRLHRRSKEVLSCLP